MRIFAVEESGGQWFAKALTVPLFLVNTTTRRSYPGSSQTQPVWKAYPIIHKPVQYPASEHSPHSPSLEDQTCLIVNRHIHSVLAEQIYIFFELQQRGRQRASDSDSERREAEGRKRMVFHVTSSLSNGCANVLPSLPGRTFAQLAGAQDVT